MKYTRNRNERDVNFVGYAKDRHCQFHPQPPVLHVKFGLTGHNAVDVNFDVHPIVDITLYFSNCNGPKSDLDRKRRVDLASLEIDVTFELWKNHDEGFLRSVILYSPRRWQGRPPT